MGSPKKRWVPFYLVSLDIGQIMLNGLMRSVLDRESVRVAIAQA